ncbi:glycosyltransferase [Luteimonas vadosa]
MKSWIYGWLSRVPARFLPIPFKLRVLIRSGVIDQAWYGAVTGRAPANELELASGVWSDDRPRVANPLFDADYYRYEYKFSGTPGEALLHYVMAGEKLGYKPCEWFDPGFFRARNPDVPRSACALAVYTAHWQGHPEAHPYFDARWYLSHYRDVSAEGWNPLVHFIEQGIAEGREPNAYFNSAWYLERNQDIARSGMSPARHFCRYGATELRNPGPDFDMARYASKYPEYSKTGLDPLAHYLVHGRQLGIDISSLYLTLEDFALPGSLGPVRDGCVDIIVPVYRNLEETRRCLESVLSSSNRIRTRLRVINDSSPEPEVTEYLRTLAAAGQVLLEENAENQGFVRTVNRGMRAALATPECSAVLLLNSDTEVANDWVDRLHAHASRCERAGTVAPLSNNATICSYPKLGENSMPSDCSVAEVDVLAAKVNVGVSVDLPTSVGFCMLITRPCLEAVGFFDEEAFGRGYGEENDFCLKASAKGFSHLLATDVFVKHVGEVSFAATSSEGKRNAARVIEERYPQYNALIARHVGLDPSMVSRLRLTFALWERDEKPILALITHDIGGGTERRVREICDELADTHHVVVVKPVAGSATKMYLENRSAFDGFELSIEVDSGQQFAQLLAMMGVQAVQIHHLHGHGPFIRSGLAIAGVPYEFHVHDYFTVCPQITLTTIDHEYCGEPDAFGCNACIAQRPTHGATDIVNWRAHHEWAIRGASRVIAPSRDAASRISRYHPVRPDVIYHEQQPTIEFAGWKRRAISAAKPLRVVLLGVLANHKGKRKVLDAVAQVARKNLPVHFHLVGYLGLVEGEVSEGMAARFSSTGWYKDVELTDLVDEADADLFLFASTAPETYSFTLTAAMATGRPIAAPNHGAFPERLEGYPHALLFPVDTPGSELPGLLLEFAGDAAPNKSRAHASR